MADAPWPQADCDYEFPPRDEEHERRWQEAIVGSLQDGWLKLVSTGGDFADLRGECPRCGHHLHQSLEFDVILGLDAGLPKKGEFNIVCTCPDKHSGRDEKKTGCGWGGANEVRLVLRREDDS